MPVITRQIGPCFAATDNVMLIQARVDGNTAGVVPSTGSQITSSATVFSDYHTGIFTKRNVPAGAHTVEMIFASQTGGSASVNEFHLAVDYKR